MRLLGFQLFGLYCIDPLLGALMDPFTVEARKLIGFRV